MGLQIRNSLLWLRAKFGTLSKDESGNGEIIGVVVVIAIVIVLGIAFQGYITGWFGGLWDQVTEPASQIGA